MGSSSSDEDGDENWRAAVNSVAVDSSAIFRNGSNQNGTGHSKVQDIEGGKDGNSSNLKSCQARAQDLLHRYLDKTLTIIASPESSSHVCNSTIDDPEDEIRLFRRAPRGITVKPVETLERLIPRKKPRIPPRKEIDEKSPEFQSQIQSVAVDGAIIIEKAEKEKARALVRLQEKEAAAQAAAKKEEERVALLKQQRGEEWLPSIASEMLSDIIAKKRELQDRCSNLEKKHSNRAYLNGIVHTNGTHQESAKTRPDKKLSEAR